MQLFAYDGNTEGLYRGAIMESGTYVPFGDITDGQKYYDALIEQTGCSTSTDTLGCLRTVPYEQLSIAINSSPSIMSYQVSVRNTVNDEDVLTLLYLLKSIILAWLPRVDGVFLPSTFQRALFFVCCVLAGCRQPERRLSFVARLLGGLVDALASLRLPACMPQQGS